MSKQTTQNIMTGKPIKLPTSITNVVEVSSGFEAPDISRMKIVIIGRPGTGKTSLLASNPGCILLDIEKNSGTVIDPRATVLRIKPESRSAADDIRKVVSGLVAESRSNKDFRGAATTFGIDSFDSLVEIFLRDLCVKNNLDDPGDFGGGHGRGYARVREELFGMLDDLSRSGFGIALTAHLSLREINGTYLPTLNVSDSFKQQLLRWRHVMFKIDVQPKIIETKTPKGAVIRTASKDPADRQYVLITDTSTNANEFDSPKSNVPMSSCFVIPPKGAWQALMNEMSAALTRRREEAK